MNKLDLIPDATGYSVQQDPGVVDSGIVGPALRMKRDKLNSASRVSVQWTLDAIEYEYLRRVYRYSELNGNPPFLIDLIIFESDVEEYEAKFELDGLNLTEQNGATFVVQANLYVRPVVGRPSLVDYPV